MSSPHTHKGRKLSSATQTVSRLNRQAANLRTELQELRKKLAAIQQEINTKPPSQLREANEQLVLAALTAESIAETAVSDRDELVRISQRDGLTNTPNRTLMLDRIESAIHMARRHKARFAIFFVDLDHFKEINDSLGHSVGDEVLQQVARRLESAVRDSDTVSRHGGDEFLVLLAEVANAGDAAQIAGKMLAALKAPCRIGDHDLHLSASIGIAIYPEDGKDPASLISQADTAMYRSKKSGQGSFDFPGAEGAS